jgi:hypothetical protein
VSAVIAYDPALFLLERAQQVSARLGELILGESRLGVAAHAWVPVPAATFTMTEGYTPDDNGTLIYDSQTATIGLTFWDEPGDVLYPADRVRAWYSGRLLFLGTVDTTSLTYDTDPDAAHNGASRRVTFAATLVGTYAAALAKTVCWTALPAEPPITRIRRWVRVNGWS